MINPKELRIGNAVICKNHKGEDFFTTVDNVGSWGIDGSATHDGDVEGEECWPIPLTPEILESFDLFEHEGFVGANREYEVDNYTRGDFRLSFASFGGLEVMWKGQSVENIKHVHQLQNLYFALTGEELSINQNIPQ